MSFLQPDSQFQIRNHGIEQSYFDKNPKNKFWFSIHNIFIEFEGITLKNFLRPALPEGAYKIEHAWRGTEKLATILFENISPHQCIFSNHSGCALTDFKCKGGKMVKIKRNMPRPDYVSCNQEEKNYTSN